MRLLLSYFDFVDIVIILEILLIKMKGLKKAHKLGLTGPVTEIHFDISLTVEKRVSYNKEGKHTVYSIAYSLCQICLC